MKQNYSFMSTIRKYAESGKLLIVATIAALIAANLPSTRDLYSSFWQEPLQFVVAGFDLLAHNGKNLTIGGFINDFFMAIFFLSVGLELKREIFCGGELSSLRKALLPVLAAIGGMIMPTIVFGVSCYLTGDATYMEVMERGMPIPMATDIAFSLGVLSIFSKRVPLGLKVFLAALAVADDLGGIIVIALFYSSTIDINYLLLAGLCVAVLIIGNNRKIMSKNFYLLTGIVLWYMMLNSGIHSTIAGVIVAFCIPATLKMGTGHYLERIRNNVNKFPVIEIDKLHNTIVLTNDQIHTLKSIESAADKMISPLQDLEDTLHAPINYIVIPLFAFANAGVDLSQMSLEGLFSGVGLAVMLGLVIGKFVGVFSFSWLAVRLGIVTLPAGASWRAFASVCVVCGIGFTVSMFIADLSYAGLGAEGAALLGEAKLGVLIGSVISAVIGCVLLNKTLPQEAPQHH
mgnify:CR=1 FL=1